MKHASSGATKTLSIPWFILVGFLLFAPQLAYGNGTAFESAADPTATDTTQALSQTETTILLSIALFVIGIVTVLLLLGQSQQNKGTALLQALEADIQKEEDRQ